MIEVYPEDPAGHVALGDFYAERGDSRRAEAVYLELKKKRPEK